MMPLTVHGLLPLPQDIPGSPADRLPWPEGSILSGRIEPTSDPQQGLLLIGGYRLLAQIPPNTPKQMVWLQLVDANLPANFRKLTATQAETEIARMLQEHVGKAEEQHPTSQPGNAQQPAAFNQADLPYRFVPISQMPLRWFITDKQQDEQTPRGMLKGEATAHGFQLRGRIDLQNLGSVSFIIADAPKGIRLSLFAAAAQGYRTLQRDLPLWLAGRKAADGLEASLHPGSVEDEAEGDARLA